MGGTLFSNITSTMATSALCDQRLQCELRNGEVSTIWAEEGLVNVLHFFQKQGGPWVAQNLLGNFDGLFLNMSNNFFNNMILFYTRSPVSGMLTILKMSFKFSVLAERRVTNVKKTVTLKSTSTLMQNFHPRGFSSKPKIISKIGGKLHIDCECLRF